MKILVFGIDGLGKGVLEGLRLRRLSKRIYQGKVEIPQIKNVISRGWPEIYCGKDAFETGGFYQVPHLADKIRPTQSTGLSAIKKVGIEDYLWTEIKKLNLSVGLFTIPTISKPETNTVFCVAATGAGKVTNEITEDDLFPKDLFRGLNIKEIDLGFRMGNGAFLPSSISELEINANKHLADYFFTLTRVLDRNNVDVCFAATRFITEMAYKFLGVCISEPKNNFEKELRTAVLALCESFDMLLDDFINKVNPEHLFIVSDHGLSEFKYDLNLNQFLFENGLIAKEQGIIRFAKNIVIAGLSKMYPKKYSPLTPRYDLKSGEYFSIGYMNALFLYDQRFNGPSYTKSEAYQKSILFSDKLNELAKNSNLDDYINFSAIDHAGVVGSAENTISVPNIFCSMAEGLYNSERQYEVLSKKENNYEKMFTHGFHGEYSACKGNDTIAAYCGPLTADVNLSRLTTVYDTVIKAAKKVSIGRIAP